MGHRAPSLGRAMVLWGCVLAPLGTGGKATPLSQTAPLLLASTTPHPADADAQWVEEDVRWYKESVRVGVAAAVRASLLPERAQRRIAAAIVRESSLHALDPLLVVALIQTESAFDAFAHSPAGALGLMQVMPETGRWLLARRGQSLPRIRHLYEPELNIELGTAYLAELWGRFGRLEHALVAYNAGPSAARKLLANPAQAPRFLEGYPRKVMDEYQRLRLTASITPTTTGTAKPSPLKK